MKWMDCVEVTAEKEEYAKDGVHKGMQGVIWEPECKNEAWVVLVPQCGEKSDIADIYIKEEDLKVVPVMHAAVNEEIKARFEDSEKGSKGLTDKPDDMSDYMV